MCVHIRDHVFHMGIDMQFHRLVNCCVVLCLRLARINKCCCANILPEEFSTGEGGFLFNSSLCLNL